MVVVDGWETGSTYPDGHYVHDLGMCGDLEPELKALMIEQEMTTHLQPHSEEGIADVASWIDPDLEHQKGNSVNADADDTDKSTAADNDDEDDHTNATHDVPESKLFEAPSRVDLRPQALTGKAAKDFFVFSVDPDGCTDIDDAMSIRRLRGPGGTVTYELGVHIADVTR